MKHKYAVVLVLMLACSEKVPTTSSAEVEPFVPPVPSQPLTREPTFNPEGRANDGATVEQATKIANLAMRAVYERCSSFAVFREGAALEGDYQNYKRVFSNVRVRLANAEKTRGHVLWYQVFFEGERPVSFQATKPIAAELCGLSQHEVEVAL
jgi:hypothetical protein